MKRIRTIDIANISLMAALIVVCSWITLPMTIPFTLQTFAVFVSVGVLGVWKGTASVLVYLFMGLVGVPVFSGFKGGAGVLLGPTGGYIIGFVFSALATGLIMKKFKGFAASLLAMLAGLIVCYVFGTVWFMVVYSRGHEITLGAAVSMCIVPYIIPDLAKICVAAQVSAKVRRYLRAAEDVKNVTTGGTDV